MFAFDHVKLAARRAVWGFGAIAIGLVVSPASASQLTLFPFLPMPIVQEQAVSEPDVPQVQGYAADDETISALQAPARFKRQIVSYETRESPGTIVVDTANTYLYFVLGRGQAIRYGIGVGRDGFTWSGVQAVSRKAEWPNWTPPADMLARQPYLPRFMVGGPGNPLGARAMYLGGTIYRIHGTNDPSTIGQRVSSGCIRLTNGDVADLYSRVHLGTKVVVLPGERRTFASSARRG